MAAQLNPGQISALFNSACHANQAAQLHARRERIFPRLPDCTGNIHILLDIISSFIKHNNFIILNERSIKRAVQHCLQRKINDVVIPGPEVITLDKSIAHNGAGTENLRG